METMAVYGECVCDLVKNCESRDYNKYSVHGESGLFIAFFMTTLKNQSCCRLYISLANKLYSRWQREERINRHFSLFTSCKAWQQWLFDWPLYLTPIDIRHKMKPDRNISVGVNVTQTLSHRHRPYTPACNPDPTCPLWVCWSHGSLFISLSLPAWGLIQLATMGLWMRATQLASAWWLSVN